MRISDWSSDVCSSDLRQLTGFFYQGDVFGVEYGLRDSAAEAVTNAVLARRPASSDGPDAPGQNRALERALDSANQCIFLLGRRNASERVAAFLLIAAKRLSAIGRDRKSTRLNSSH